MTNSIHEFLHGDAGSPSHEDEVSERELTEKMYRNYKENSYIQSQARQTLDLMVGCKTMADQIEALKTLGYSGVKISGGRASFDNLSEIYRGNVYSLYQAVIRGLMELTKNPSSPKYQSLARKIHNG